MVRELGTARLGLASETGLPFIDGADTFLLEFPAFASDESLRLTPQTGSDDLIQTYALGFDVFIPSPASAFTSLLQTGGGDGELFLRDNGDGTAGIGIDGVYNGAVPYDAWNRIVLTVTQESGDTILRTYLNGTEVGVQNLGATTRWAIDPAEGLKLFNDNDGETSGGAVSSVFYTPDVGTPDEVATVLATIPVPAAGGFFPGQPTPNAVELNFTDNDVTPRYGDAQVSLDGFGFQTATVINESAIALASQLGIDGPDGADIPVLDYAAYSPAEGILVDLPETGADLTSYTAIWDIRFDELSGFQALFQTDPSQSGDGELFIRSDGGIGINGDYDGTVTPDTWHRIAITVEDQGDGTSILSKYLDGAFLDSQSVDTERFSLSRLDDLLLLSDNDRETSTGHLAHFGLSEEVLDAAAIAGLGGADADGPLTAASGGGSTLPVGDRNLTLSFDSSFKPYADQTGDVLVSFDGGTSFTSLLTLDTATVGGNSVLDRINETISIDFVAPDGTEAVEFRFDYVDADNDWWWAIDNLSLSEGGSLLWAENFDGLTDDLQPAVDESIAADLLGWTDTPPEGWSRENAPTMPQGTTEWQGWSFATPEFWTAADGQNRGDFTLGTGVVAIADGDEWDDFNDGSQTGNDFNSSLTTPEISLALGGGSTTYQLGFDNYEATVEFGFDDVTVIDVEEETARQDNIKDLLLKDDGTVQEIDLLAAFGPDATGFAVTTADGAVVDAVIDGTTLNLSGLTLGHSDITVTATGPGGQALEENFRAIVAGENAYVFAIMPDTQDYTSNPGIAATFGNMADWLLAQQDSLQIEHLIHVGDIVQFGAVEQWLIAEDALERLDGELSYSLAIGNHDQQRPGFASSFSFESDVDTYFTPEQVGATAAQGGGTYDGFDVGEDTFANGNTYSDSIRNHYTTLETKDGTNWLVLNLEMGMPDDVLRWASEVIEEHLDHRVIINTHSWNGGDGRITPTTEPLTTDNGAWGYSIRDNPRNVNDGEDAWRELASKYPNIMFTFNGHNFMGGAETVISQAAGDNPVFQMFVNYQNGAWQGVPGVGTNGGNGALRLVVMDPDNDRITTHTKLTELDTFYDAFPDHQEVFEGVDLGAPEQIVIAKAGDTEVVTGDGISASVSLDPGESLGDTTGAVFEWFAADGVKLGESDGTPLEVELKTGVNRLTLKVTDQNGNVSTEDKVVIVDAPDNLLTETFDDGDADGWLAPTGDAGALVDITTDLASGLPSIGGVDQIPLTLQFDSSFRPYDDMTGEVLVSFDDGASFTSLLTLDTASLGGNSVLDRVNETVTLSTLAPSSASSVQFAWRLSEGGNDWWWAIDNIEVTADGLVLPPLLSESFDSLPLQNTVDEVDPGVPVWTPTPPDGWQQENAPAMPQGATEFQGWTFLDSGFWIDTAGNQSRDQFTLAQNTVAVADPDEWDDTGPGAGEGDFDSTLRTPGIDITGIGGGQAAGPEAGLARVPGLSPEQGILVTPTGTSGVIDSYSLVFDILLSETTQSFTSLFQTNVANGDDAEIYLRNDGGTASIGISGDYDGALQYGAWGRLALVFETDATGQQTLSKYLDGVLLDTQVVDTDVSDGSRWSIDADTGFLLFSEPAGFTSEIFANALYFAEGALDEATIAGFGGVDVDGPADAARFAGDFQLSFDGSLDAADFGAATVESVSFGDSDLGSYLVKGSIFGNPNGEGEAALYQQSNGANELLVWQGDGAETWSNYTFDMVVEPADNDTIGALFYYQDDSNFYRLLIDQQSNTRTLVKVEDGVESVLATESGSYRHFASQDLRIAVLDGDITITLDDELLFGGVVNDAAPLSGGSVGIVSQGMDRVAFDDIAVNPISLAARALTETPSGRWVADLDGDGTATVQMSAVASLSAAGIAGYEWLVDGEVVATGETAALELRQGETTVTLQITDTNGAISTDDHVVSVAANGAILVQDDFEDGNTDGWIFVDEGTIDGPSDWQLIDGALVQTSDIQSSQQGTGSTAFSTGGDGPFILRDGTYALWNDPAAQGWTNYAFEATITPNDNDGIGLLFRYVDADNYYKLESDAETGLVMLTRHLDGRETILARGYTSYTPGEAQHWRIEVEDGVITPYIDGKAVFGSVIEDHSLPAGTVGLYGWGSENLTFDNVLVTELGYVPPDLKVVLIDADTDEVIATLGKGGTDILASQIVGKDLSIAAFVNEDGAYAGQVESMRLNLNDGARTKVENIEPYSLFGDFPAGGNQNYIGREGLLQDENTITFDLYSQNRANGELLDSISRTFNVIDDVEPMADDLRIVLIDARTEQEITEITDGTTIDADLVAGKRLTIAVYVEDEFLMDVTDSVRMSLNDDFSRTENVEPYSLFGDISFLGYQNFFGRRNILEEGDNTLELALYTDDRARGDELGTVSVDFSIGEVDAIF